MLTSRIQRALLLMLTLLFGCRESILHELSERDAIRAQVALEDSGIAASRVREGTAWQITVDEADAPAALRLIDELMLIPKPSTTLQEFSKGLLPSKDEQQLFREERLRKSLEEMLENLPSVRVARVHLSLGTPGRAEHKNSLPGTAAVLLLARPNASLNSEEVQRLLSSSTGIVPERVSVVVQWMPAVAKPPATDPQRVTAFDPRWLLVLIPGTGLLFVLRKRSRRAKSARQSLLVPMPDKAWPVAPVSHNGTVSPLNTEPLQ